MRLFYVTSVLVVVCSLFGCAGEIPATMAEQAKALQLATGTATKPTVAIQREGSIDTTSYTVSVSITIEPAQVPSGSADDQETASH